MWIRTNNARWNDSGTNYENEHSEKPKNVEKLCDLLTNLEFTCKIGELLIGGIFGLTTFEAGFNLTINWSQGSNCLVVSAS